MKTDVANPYSPYKFGITITRSEYGAGSFTTLENLDAHIDFQRARYQSYLQANTIEQVFVILDIRKILRDFPTRIQEEAIG